MAKTILRNGFLSMNNFLEKASNVFSQLSLVKIAGILVLFIVLIIISKCIVKLVNKMLSRTKLGSGFAGFIATILRYVLYFVSVLIVCDSAGLPVTSLLALFSLFGLAVSLSVQSLLGNLMSGLSLHTLKPFAVGDYIETDIAGTVKSIGLFYTELTTPDNKKVFIPNEKIMADKLINYTAEGVRRIDLVFNAGYEYDTELVKTVLREAVMGIDAVHKDPEPVIGIAEYGESAINYSVYVWTDATEYIDTKFAVMDVVGVAYKRNGIKMAYNRLEVEMVNKEEKSIK